MLFTTTAITGPNGEQVDRDRPIPDTWDVNSDFVTEGVKDGWLVNRDDVAPPPPPATLPSIADLEAARGNNPSANVGGNATREGTGTA